MIYVITMRWREENHVIRTFRKRDTGTAKYWLRGLLLTWGDSSAE
jgi:hypothetical protein